MKPGKPTFICHLFVFFQFLMICETWANIDEFIYLNRVKINWLCCHGTDCRAIFYFQPSSQGWMLVKLHFKFLCKSNISLREGARNAVNSLPHSCIQPISFAKHIGALQRDTQNGCITERLSVSNCWSRQAIKKAWLSKAKKEKKNDWRESWSV